MIATILQSSKSFAAVDYNERKVAQGDATLLCMENLPLSKWRGEYSADEMQQELIDYSKRNTRIKKTQMHVAFSCKGKELNHTELVQFARQWLDEMGYGDRNQPLLIYAHNDTDNNHIHVITFTYFSLPI